jgi:hypothetical protein
MEFVEAWTVATASLSSCVERALLSVTTRVERCRLWNHVLLCTDYLIERPYDTVDSRDQMITTLLPTRVLPQRQVRGIRGKHNMRAVLKRLAAHGGDKVKQVRRITLPMTAFWYGGEGPRCATSQALIHKVTRQQRGHASESSRLQRSETHTVSRLNVCTLRVLDHSQHTVVLLTDRMGSLTNRDKASKVNMFI